MSYLKKSITLLLLIGFTALSCGCNTISGIGEDMQSAGRAIEQKAEKSSD